MTLRPRVRRVCPPSHMSVVGPPLFGRTLLSASRDRQGVLAPRRFRVTGDPVPHRSSSIFHPRPLELGTGGVGGVFYYGSFFSFGNSPGLPGVPVHPRRLSGPDPPPLITHLFRQGKGVFSSHITVVPASLKPPLPWALDFPRSVKGLCPIVTSPGGSWDPQPEELG